jgi:Skp family chaperone for outer membrane proteins
MDYLANVIPWSNAAMGTYPKLRGAQSGAARTPRAIAAIVTATLAMCMCAGMASAALYKWTDANGRVVYSDQPPPPGTNAKTETLNAPAPAANASAVKEMANKDAELKKRQADRAEEAKKAEKAKAEADRRAESCTQLRSQIRLFNTNDTAIYRANEKGEPVYMDDAAKKRERARLEGLSREQNCPQG